MMMTSKKTSTDFTRANSTEGRRTVECGDATDLHPALLTSAQAANLAGVGQRTWWRWMNSGLAPPPVKIGLGPRAAERITPSGAVTMKNQGASRSEYPLSHATPCP